MKRIIQFGQPRPPGLIYKENDRIILEPMVEIPAREVWLYENKVALEKVKKGLSQKGTIKRGSFSKYAK